MMRMMRLQADSAIFARAAGLVSKLRRPAAMLGLLFLCMHAQLAPGQAPLAAAMFAAGLAAGENIGALAAGCILGALRLPLKDSMLLPAIACACILAGEIAFSALRFLKKTPRQLRASILAGFGVLLPALIWAGGELIASMQGLACAALASACAPFLLSALQLQPGRKWYLMEERAGMVLLAGGTLCGLCSLSAPVAEFAAGLCLLAAEHVSAGAVCGIFLMLGGAPPAKLAALAICGAAAGFVRNRPHRAVAAAVCAAISRLWLGADALSWLAMPLAAGAYLLVPEDLLDRVRRFFSPDETAADPQRIADAVTAESRRRLQALGDAFGDMAEGYAEPGDMMCEQDLICAMRERLCSGCADYAHCWAGSENCGARFLCSLVGDALSLADAPPGRRMLFSDGEIPPDVLRICRRGRMIPDRLSFLLRDFVEKRRAEIKRSENTRMLSAQLLQAREILYDLARRQGQALHFQGDKIARVRAALDSAGLGEVTVCVRGMQEIGLSRIGPDWSRAEIQRAGAELGRTFGGRYLPERIGGSLRFVRHPRLSARTGVACQSGVAGEICGDSHILRMLDDGRLMALICDGMGMGEAAARESCETSHLIWRFLNAGISNALAIEAANQQMLTRSGEDMFATVDLCLIDLNSGVAEFTKLAASRSIILRGGEVMTVEGGHLPLGILEGVQPAVTRIRLRPDDVLIMGSDGVMEAGDGRMIERIARAGSGQDAQQLAEQLVREAALRRAHARTDDMSCICLTLRRVTADTRCRAEYERTPAP